MLDNGYPILLAHKLLNPKIPDIVCLTKKTVYNIKNDSKAIRTVERDKQSVASNLKTFLAFLSQDRRLVLNLVPQPACPTWPRISMSAT